MSAHIPEQKSRAATFHVVLFMSVGGRIPGLSRAATLHSVDFPAPECGFLHGFRRFLDLSKSVGDTRGTTREFVRSSSFFRLDQPTTKEKAKMATIPSDKLKACETALTQIERQFGKGSIMRLGAKEFVPISSISSGSIGVDAALGVGGLPRGRIVEIFGPESSGKTTLSLHVIAEAQKTGGLAAFIDAEHALDAEYAKKLGVDVDNLLVSQPDSGEQALEIAEMLVRSNAIDIIVIDSVAALVPRAELEGEMGDSHVGLQARLMSQALRKLTGIVSKSKTCMVFINQIREKIGVMFGNPETTTGGRALKFYSSIRLDIRRTNQIKEGEEVVGSRVKVKVVKNKCAAPFRHAEFDVGYGEGISKTGELLDIGLENKIIEKSGSWWSYGDMRLGQGRENSKAFIKDNPQLMEEIEVKVRRALGMGVPELTVIEGGEPSAAATQQRRAAK
jgi:recombination protein RecA